MKLLYGYSRFLDGLTKVLRVILITLISSMIIIMTYQAVMRYLFNNSKPWCEELTLYLSMLSIMLALGIASRRDSHLQVDFLTRMYGPRLKCLATAVFSFTAIVVMFIFSLYAVRLIGHANGRSVTMPLTMAQIYTIFPVGSAVLILYSVEIVARNAIGFLHNGALPELSKKVIDREAEK